MRRDVLVALSSFLFILALTPGAKAAPQSAWYSYEADRMSGSWW